MNFFKTFLASCLGSLVAFLVLSVLMIFFFTALISGLSSDDSLTVVKEKSVLNLNLDVPITENDIEDPLEDLPIPGAVSTMGLLPLKRAIEHAKTDPKIEGIYLEVSTFMSGYGVAREIRESLLDFKTSGKWIISYSEFYTEPSYYIASVADQVLLHPEGELEFNGLSVEVSFFKKLFDKLEIKPQIFRVGDFKSAVEPFMLDHLSAENKLQLNELITDLHTTMLQDIAATRGMEVNQIRTIAKQAIVTNPLTARENGLVDSLVYFDQVVAAMRNRIGLGEDDKVALVKVGKYKKSFSSYSTSKNEIAVIVADGDILPGKAQTGMIGSETFAEELRKARTNDRVKAIVLRINSPGGSALASDVMWREIQLASEVKPIIASMSDYAASGGYYLAMACDTIVAQPTSITGSIGVFSVLFDLSSFLDHKLGITFEEVKTGELGEMVTVTRPLTNAEKAIWQKRTDEIYETFTTKAAAGRGMSVEDLKKVASGRVWTGTQAQARGLVDVLGDFDDAVAIASSRANVKEDYKLRYYPVQKSFLQEWLTGMEENAGSEALQKELGQHYYIYQQLRRLKDYQGSQARMPYKLIIN
jgi:protease IV